MQITKFTGYNWKIFYPIDGRCKLIDLYAEFEGIDIPHWALSTGLKKTPVCNYHVSMINNSEVYVSFDNYHFKRVLRFEGLVFNEVHEYQKLFVFYLCIRKRLPKDMRKLVWLYIKH